MNLSSTVEELIKQQNIRSNRTEKVKEKILETLKDKISNYSYFGKTNCIFTIPNFMIGYVPYNVIDISKFIIRKLKNEGLFVLKLNDENIYISWNVNDLYKDNSKLKSKENKKKQKDNNNIESIQDLLELANKNKL